MDVAKRTCFTLSFGNALTLERDLEDFKSVGTASVVLTARRVDSRRRVREPDTMT